MVRGGQEKNKREKVETVAVTWVRCDGGPQMTSGNTAPETPGRGFSHCLQRGHLIGRF